MFRTPVSVYMTLDPITVREDASLEEVASALERRRISAMPVVDGQGRTVGVVSRRDLLREGQLVVPEGRGVAEWKLPEMRADDVMTRQILSIAPSTSVAEAAALMLDQHVHRLFVEQERRLHGVLTTRDVMRVIVDHHLERPISDFMTQPVQTIATFEPLGVARRQLKELKIRGLVVADEGCPVGVFAEEEALASRHHDAALAVDQVMGHEVLVLRPEVPAHRAAAQMRATHVRRIVAMKAGDMVGMLTETNLAGAAAVS